MFKHLVKIALAFIAISLTQSVIVSHQDNDIRDSILSSFQNKPKRELFKVYHFLHQKKYDLNSEEGLKRYRIFKSNMKFIESQNAKNLGYTLGITDFTDLTADEFRKTKLTTIDKQELESSLKKFLSTDKGDFEIHNQDDDDIIVTNDGSDLTHTKIDWTSKMNPAGDQDGCGSCWAFATVHAIEGNYNVQFGNSPSFSTQQLVDCEKLSNACKGGSPIKALNYILQRGIASSEKYPYTSGFTGYADACKENIITMNQVLTGYDQCDYLTCTKTKQRALLAKGPIIVHMDGDGQSEGSSIFQHYKEGILTMPCDEVNHVVVLTGVESDHQGEFYRGMNSWGRGWGENGGYFRFRARASDNSCHIEEWGLLPKVKKINAPLPPPPKSDCMRIFSECGMKGQVKEICGNTPVIANFPNMAGYNIGKFKSLKIFTDEQNCRGSYFDLKHKSFDCFATSGLTKLVNNIKSVIVEEIHPPAGCVWLYDDYCLSGKKLEVCADVSNLNDHKFNFGNKVSSFKFGHRVTGINVYVDKNFSGTSARIMRERYSLFGHWLNKDIESLKIIKA